MSKTVTFLTIQFSVSTQFKYSLSTDQLSETFLFQAIQLSQTVLIVTSSVSWGCRIHRLLLCIGVRSPQH